MTVSWVVVADSSIARIFSREGKKSPLQEVVDLTHPASRRLPQDMESDRPGRSFDSAGSGRHGMEPRHSKKANEAGHFAREIAGYLIRHKKEFTGLIIIAAPGFLGQLRKQMDNTISERVVKEIKKDVTKLKADAISRLI